MNIKQAQQPSGVSTDNIRFYEKQGLLCPNAIKPIGIGSIPTRTFKPSSSSVPFVCWICPCHRLRRY